MNLVYCYAETKEMSYESVNLKGVTYEPKHNTAAFGLSPHVQVWQTLARSFIMFI